MRPHGDWEFTGHAFPGKPCLWLKFEGADQKSTLTREALKRKVQIQNRFIITDVIAGDRGVIGAIGLSLQEEQPILRIFRAKAVILTTGSTNRLYPPVTPGMMFNTVYCPSCAGSGRAIALRAGATLVNMEIPNRHAGPKYFARAGKASWIGVFTDPFGKPVGPFVEKPTKDLGDITADIWNSVFTDMVRLGRGPVYMDCTRTSAEDLKYMMWGLRHEGATAMLDYMGAEGIDLRQHRVEFTRYEPFLTGRGIEINEQGETTIEGFLPPEMRSEISEPRWPEPPYSGGLPGNGRLSEPSRLVAFRLQKKARWWKKGWISFPRFWRGKKARAGRKSTSRFSR